MSRSPLKVSIVADTKCFRKQLKRVQRKLWWFSIDWRNVGGWVLMLVLLVATVGVIFFMAWTLGKMLLLSICVVAVSVLLAVLMIGPSVGAND
jgi:hypothetical protein